METINPSTRPMMMLLLWVLYFGHTTFGSPLDSHEMELLEMIFRDAEGYPSSDRDPRDIDVLPASSIGCDDSGSAEYNMFDDLARSEECLDCLPPCEEPVYDDRLPMEHPCFVRMLLLRTPLLKQDPCANFSLATQPPRVNKKPKHKKCNPKAKKQKTATKIEPVPPSNNGTLNSTAAPIATSTEPNSKIIRISKLVPRKRKNTTTTSTSTTSTTTTLETTTVEETTRPVELTTTTTETEPPTTTELETTTLPPTTTEPPLADNQLKRFTGMLPRKKNVPDPPQIKLDGNLQPSEVIQVIVTTEAAELMKLPDGENSTTVTPTTAVVVTTSVPETTTEESCEAESMGDSGDGESSKQGQPEFPETQEQDVEGKRTGGDHGGEEPCEDTEEQDTNLCPQVVPAQRNGKSHSRHPPPPRFRKPIKNYVEPILYEGHFDKPHHQMPPIGPQQRDFFISNKQIMPRPKPKYKKRIPPSIYVNNIVRGMDCNDENDSQSEEHPRNPPSPPQRHWDLRRIGVVSRNQVLRKPVTERNVRNFVPMPARRLSSFPEHSVSIGPKQEKQYVIERDPEPRPIHPHYSEEEFEMGNMPRGTSSPSLDPCQQEHDYLQRKILHREPNESRSQHPTPSHVFT
nr:eukaryotic translation initiation factor 4 gamma [Drosophila bipectinata]